MNFNVSTIKNKNAQNKVNTCMSSIKHIIEDYKPIEDKEKDYGIFEYYGEVTGETSITLPGKNPSMDQEVMGMTAGLSVHAGKLTKDGKFIGRDILFKDYSKRTTIETSIWDYGDLTSSTEVTPERTPQDEITISGYPPIISGTKYSKQDEVIYETDDPDEVLLDISTNDLNVKVLKKDTDIYEQGITLDSVYSAFLAKTSVIIMEGRQSLEDPTKWTYVVRRNSNDASLFMEIAETPFAQLIFADESFGVKVYGKDDIILKYNQTANTVEEGNIKTITTITDQPYKVISDVRKVDNHWVYNYQVQLEKTTEVEKWTTNQITNVYIKQYYI